MPLRRLNSYELYKREGLLVSVMDKDEPNDPPKPSLPSRVLKNWKINFRDRPTKQKAGTENDLLEDVLKEEPQDQPKLSLPSRVVKYWKKKSGDNSNKQLAGTENVLLESVLKEEPEDQPKLSLPSRVAKYWKKKSGDMSAEQRAGTKISLLQRMMEDEPTEEVKSPTTSVPFRIMKDFRGPMSQQRRAGSEISLLQRMMEDEPTEEVKSPTTSVPFRIMKDFRGPKSQQRQAGSEITVLESVSEEDEPTEEQEDEQFRIPFSDRVINYLIKNSRNMPTPQGTRNVVPLKLTEYMCRQSETKKPESSTSEIPGHNVIGRSSSSSLKPSAVTTQNCHQLPHVLERKISNSEVNPSILPSPKLKKSSKLSSILSKKQPLLLTPPPVQNSSKLSSFKTDLSFMEQQPLTPPPLKKSLKLSPFQARQPCPQTPPLRKSTRRLLTLLDEALPCAPTAQPKSLKLPSFIVDKPLPQMTLQQKSSELLSWPSLEHLLDSPLSERSLNVSFSEKECPSPLPQRETKTQVSSFMADRPLPPIPPQQKSSLPSWPSVNSLQYSPLSEKSSMLSPLKSDSPHTQPLSEKGFKAHVSPFVADRTLLPIPPRSSSKLPSSASFECLQFASLIAGSLMQFPSVCDSLPPLTQKGLKPQMVSQGKVEELSDDEVPFDSRFKGLPLTPRVSTFRKAKLKKMATIRMKLGSAAAKKIDQVPERVSMSYISTASGSSALCVAEFPGTSSMTSPEKKQRIILQKH